MWYSHAMEYYSALKGNEILIHATTWMNLKNITPKQKKPITKDDILYDSRIYYKKMSGIGKSRQSILMVA